jgi:hypothetical protein
MRKTKFANKMPRQRDKLVSPVDILTKNRDVVTACDICGKPLGRSCVRTSGSVVCAEGEGIFTKRYPGGLIKFFCSLECKRAG